MKVSSVQDLLSELADVQWREDANSIAAGAHVTDLEKRCSELDSARPEKSAG